MIACDEQQSDKQQSAETPSVAATEVKARALSGIKALGTRTFVSILLRMVSSLILARLLFPRDYGVFAIAAYITGLGMFLCDVGLGGALVRQQREPSEDEAVTVFFCQQAVTGFVVMAVIVTVPWLERFYRLTPSATAMLMTMTLGLFLSSLRVVPMMALERSLRFPLVARCEMIQNIAQTGSTITLAALHCGAWSLAGGGLIGNSVGLLCVWVVSPWRPRGRLQWPIILRLARFGIPFQLNALMPTIIGGWMPLVVGRLLGVAAVGLVGWAANIASIPMMLSGILNRVAFPAYSRLQSDPAALNSYLQVSLQRLSAALCLVVPLAVIVCPVAVPLIFGRRWSPVIPLVQWLGMEAGVLIFTGILASLQNALGRPSERLAVTIAAGSLRWSLGCCAVSRFGILGVGPAMFTASAMELLATCLLLQARKVGGMNLVRNAVAPLLLVGATLGLSIFAGSLVGHRDALITMSVSLSVFLMLTLIREAVTQGQTMFRDIRSLVAMIKPA